MKKLKKRIKKDILKSSNNNIEESKTLIEIHKGYINLFIKDPKQFYENIFLSLFILLCSLFTIVMTYKFFKIGDIQELKNNLLDSILKGVLFLNSRTYDYIINYFKQINLYMFLLVLFIGISIHIYKNKKIKKFFKRIVLLVILFLLDYLLNKNEFKIGEIMFHDLGLLFYFWTIFFTTKLMFFIFNDKFDKLIFKQFLFSISIGIFCLLILSGISKDYIYIILYTFSINIIIPIIITIKFRIYLLFLTIFFNVISWVKFIYTGKININWSLLDKMLENNSYHIFNKFLFSWTGFLMAMVVLYSMSDDIKNKRIQEKPNILWLDILISICICVLTNLEMMYIFNPIEIKSYLSAYTYTLINIVLFAVIFLLLIKKENYFIYSNEIKSQFIFKNILLLGSFMFLLYSVVSSANDIYITVINIII